MKQIHQQLFSEEERDTAVWDLCVLDLRDVSNYDTVNQINSSQNFHTICPSTCTPVCPCAVYWGEFVWMKGHQNPVTLERSVQLLLRMSVHLLVHVCSAVCISACPTACRYVWPSTCTSAGTICLPMSLLCLQVQLLMHLCVHLLEHLSVQLFVYLLVH